MGGGLGDVVLVYCVEILVFGHRYMVHTENMLGYSNQDSHLLMILEKFNGLVLFHFVVLGCFQNIPLRQKVK